METSKKIQSIIDEFKNKREYAETYTDVFKYAERYGGVTSNVFKSHLKELVVDGYMSAENANIIKPILQDMYDDIAYKAKNVQDLINNISGVGLNAIQSALDNDRIDGIIKRVSSEEFEKIKWILGEPIINFAQSAVDDTLQANIDFQGKAGLKPKIKRVLGGDACEWCRNLVGTYSYPDVPQDVYRRHENCRCTVEYIGNGKKQNVWSKKLDRG